VLVTALTKLSSSAIRTFLLPQDEVILPAPSFLVYKLAVQTMGAKTVPIRSPIFTIDLKRTAKQSPRERESFLSQSQQPYGTIVKKADFDLFMERIPSHALVVLDEAYIEFVKDGDTPSGFDYIHRPGPHVIVARTFSKAHGLAGLRIGYG